MNRRERQGFPASILWVLVALTLGWGFNWPMIKLALTEMPLLSFRSVCLLGGAAGPFAIAARAGLRLGAPPGLLGGVALVTLFNTTPTTGIISVDNVDTPTGTVVAILIQAHWQKMKAMKIL